jgi:methylenetetrahydrofolate dehydrogenase (NADP+)/methenyltetrahydrofolate cyclohydrolase
LQERVARLRPRLGRVPGPAVVLVGSDAASRIHVRKKRGVCERVAIRSGPHDLPVGTTQEELLKLVDEFNADASAVDGILVQMPLSANIDDETVIEHIAPKKDVEGFHPFNIGRLATKLPALRLCTPRGVMKLLGHTRNIHQGQHAVVVGSNHVGRPMSLELLAENCTVTTCHVYTQDLPQYVAGADSLVVAGGKANLIRDVWVKEGGNRDRRRHQSPSRRLTARGHEFRRSATAGSLDHSGPGGVGLMTLATHLENTVDAAEGLYYKQAARAMFNQLL